MISKDQYLNQLIEEALAMEQESAREAGALGFMARILVQATMPHSPVKTNEFVRKNGYYTLSMMAPTHIGLPYGSIPRLLLAWISTECVRTRNRELILGDSMSSFMEKIGLVPTGGRWGTITRLKDQTTRLFASTIHCHYADDVKTAGINIIIADKNQLWWEPANPNQITLWKSTVMINDSFFQEIIQSPVPIDMRALKILKSSPFALDIYTWLTYRMSYLKKRTEIPWVALQEQFGANYAKDKGGKYAFKMKFKEQLKKIIVIYPDLNIEEGKLGLVLLPSNTHIERL